MMKLKVTVNGTAYDVEVEPEEEPPPVLGAFTFGPGATVDPTVPAAPTDRSPSEGTTEDGDALRCTLSGTVTRVEVGPGTEVAQGQVVLVLEAMKMETEVTAPTAGTVRSVEVVAGDAVSIGQVLVTWET
jgi:methylmalonyl-CoA carboxyltransferase small subunit